MGWQQQREKFLRRREKYVVNCIHADCGQEDGIRMHTIYNVHNQRETDATCFGLFKLAALVSSPLSS